MSKNKNKATSKPKELDENEINQAFEVLKSNIREFFNIIPDHTTANTAEMLIVLIAIEGSHNMYEAIGILEESKRSFQYIHDDAQEMDDDEEDELDFIPTAFANKDKLVN